VCESMGMRIYEIVTFSDALYNYSYWLVHV
jgi:hypothetical protein